MDPTPSPAPARRDGGLRVLHLTVTIDRGGAENYLVDLIKAQLEAGYAAIACAYLKGGDYWGPWLRSNGVEVADLGMRFYGDPRPLFRLVRLIRRFRPDIVHVHGAPFELYALAARAFGRRPRLMLTRHEPRRRLFTIPGYRLLDRMISAAAGRVIAVSASVMAEDTARRPELAHKSLVIHHGIDPGFAARGGEDRDATRRSLGAREGDVLIGTIARHTSEKSVDTLLHAFAGLREDASLPPLKLALVGRGPLTDDLQQLAERLGLAEAVTWFAFRDDIPAFLHAVDIFALPSREEGFGIVLLEAMICARPVVACRIDAIPEIVIDGETGMVVPPLDPEPMRAALAALAGDPVRRNEMGAAGRARVLQKFTLDTMRRETRAAYRDLLGVG